MKDYDGDPNRFVKENGQLLVRLLKHSNDEFVRGMALASLIEYGEEPQLQDVIRELQDARNDDGEDV